MLVGHFIDESGTRPQFREGPFEQAWLAELCGISVAKITELARSCGHEIGPDDTLTGRQCVHIIQEVRGLG